MKDELVLYFLKSLLVYWSTLDDCVKSHCQPKSTRISHLPSFPPFLTSVKSPARSLLSSSLSLHFFVSCDSSPSGVIPHSYQWSFLLSLAFSCLCIRCLPEPCHTIRPRLTFYPLVLPRAFIYVLIKDNFADPSWIILGWHTPRGAHTHFWAV